MADMGTGSGGWRLTPAGKLLLVLVGLAVLGFAGWQWRDLLPSQLPGSAGTQPPGAAGTAATGSGSGGAAGAASPTGVLERMRSTRVMRVGMEGDAPPLHFLNDAKQEDGFDFRVAAEVATRLGLDRVAVVEADYEDLPGLLRRGEVDVIMGGYVPDPSIEGVEWTNGYLDFGLCLIVSEGMAWKIQNPADLAGKTVAIYDDPAAERWVRDNIPGATVRKFSGDSGWFEAVESGQAAALIYDYPFAAVEIKEHPRTVIAKYNLNESKYAIGVPAKNYDLVYELNKALEQITSSPRYGELMRAYLSSTSDVFMKPVPGRNTYVVKAGDTLSRIAAARLGSTDRWREIWQLNRDRVANPDLIYPRLVLLMP
jgi:ABC-type amino acid transport substrate-binding protein